MRAALIWLVVVGLAGYAWRNWFVSTCGLILLSVIMQRQDFPQYLMGINGLNPWNVLLLVVVLSWWVHRRGELRPLDLPRPVVTLLVVCSAVVFVAYARAATDLGTLSSALDTEVSFVGFTGEFLINRVKFVIPALLLFDGCRTRQRVAIAVGVVLAAAVAYALLVIRYVPVQSLLSASESVFMSYRHRIDRDTGLMAIDMSMLLAGAFWSTVALASLAARRRSQQVGLLAAALVLGLGMALCHSRGSYIGWAAAGMVLAAVRWRRMLLLLPVAVIAVFMLFPAIPARLSMGWNMVDEAGEEIHDWDKVTAGRSTDLWPAAFEQFYANPLLGYGGEACSRTELRDRWLEHGSTAPTHPHNAYLQLLLDVGLIGFVPIMLLYGGLWLLALKLFRERRDRLAAAVGGMGLATVTVLMVTALGAQSFYPTQSTLPYWCLWALTLRVHLELSRARQQAAARYADGGAAWPSIGWPGATAAGPPSYAELARSGGPQP